MLSGSFFIARSSIHLTSSKKIFDILCFQSMLQLPWIDHIIYYGHQFGLISDERYAEFEAKKEAIKEAKEKLAQNT